MKHLWSLMKCIDTDKYKRCLRMAFRSCQCSKGSQRSQGNLKPFLQLSSESFIASCWSLRPHSQKQSAWTQCEPLSLTERNHPHSKTFTRTRKVANRQRVLAPSG